MKSIKISIIAMVALAFGFVACDNEFMNETPKVEVTIEGYFNTVTDLELYTNRYYNHQTFNYRSGLTGRYWLNDAGSDNVTGRTTGFAEQEDAWDAIFGALSKDNSDGAGLYGGYRENWKQIRNFNLFLDNVSRATGNEADIKHYTGITRLCRALVYQDMVARYSDIPWIEHALTLDDEDVYRASDKREDVMAKVIEDLEYAAANIKPVLGNKTRVNKYYALGQLARIALWEGTWRKYHSEINLPADDLLKRAASAAEEIMSSGVFEIAPAATADYGRGMTGSPAYRDLFVSSSLADNKDVIHWVEYPEPNRGRGPGIGAGNLSLSRSLQESYLTSDGKPFSSVAGYATKPYYEVFAARDPRLVETFMFPGSVTYVTDRSVVPFIGEAADNIPAFGGFSQGKFGTNLVSLLRAHHEGTPVYRYAEALLIYAEAKAELGQFDATAQAKSINLLRARVGMPAFDAAREVDETLRKQYPNVTDPTILAVRRERRVELACEGFRQHDLYRWGVGERFLDPEARQGMWVPEFGMYDTTGDEKADYAIYQKKSDIPEDWTDVGKYGVTSWYYFEDDLPAVSRGDQATTFTLSEGTHGYIVNREIAARNFRSPKDYYRPIPIEHTVLNPKLKQPFGWE